MTAMIGLPIGLAAIGAALVLSVVALGMGTPRSSIAKGLASINAHYARRTMPAEQTADREFALPPLLERLRALSTRLSPSVLLTSLHRRLDMAGKTSPRTIEKVLAHKGIGLLGIGSLGFLIGIHSPITAVGYSLIGAVAGFFVPDLLVYNTGEKRQARIRAALPDTLDMLTVCVEAGLGFDAALSHVAHSTTGPLAEEYGRMLQEMQLGRSRVETLRALGDRTSVTELRVFASALIQASELGIPTARVLQEQAKEMRIKRRQLAEEKAQKVPVKILFPLIFCIFPALFVVIMGPAVISMIGVLTQKG